jgi:hypothetical protein
MAMAARAMAWRRVARLVELDVFGDREAALGQLAGEMGQWELAILFGGMAELMDLAVPFGQDLFHGADGHEVLLCRAFVLVTGAAVTRVDGVAAPAPSSIHTRRADCAA